MKRILWGLIKIAIIVGILVWVSREFFPIENTEDVSQESQQVEELTESEIVMPQEEVVSEPEEVELPPVIRSSAPVTVQQKQYAAYSQQAGMPGIFSASFVPQGEEPLSAQLARAFGEPVGEWGNLSVHKKTFWALAELTLRDINVDAARSLHGAVITISDGDISIDLSDVSTTFVPVPTVGVVSVSFSIDPIAVERDDELPVGRTMRRMSGRAWQQVLESGGR